MTLEELATLAQSELESIRRDMATHDELRSTESRILRAIEGVDRHLQAYSLHWGGQLEQFDQRLRRVERRIGTVGD